MGGEGRRREVERERSVWVRMCWWDRKGMVKVYDLFAGFRAQDDGTGEGRDLVGNCFL